VGLPKAEEFPVFREFWIERPQPEARQLRIWALLDSPSVAGAYQFDLRPGKDTVLEIKARLFFRRKPEKVGLAPMTSMWMWGDGVERPANETRPKVHDCDGLLVCTKDGQWIWRPLSRQSYPSLSHFDFAGIRGFGLLQRDRRPSSFLDDEAKYHLRPSVWIEPKQAWSEGAVELLELPADHEGIDNIAAWWKPNKPVEIGAPLNLEYTVAFMNGEPKHALARATTTHVIRRDGRPSGLEIDFTGEPLASLPADTKVTCDVNAQRGSISNVACRKQSDGRWQVRFDIRPAGKEPVELQASIRKDGETLTETWRYLCPN
jgi:glucans biosynthesis protein